MNSPNPFAAGAAYLDGEFLPLAEAKIPITHWGYRRSDVTYDVVSVWDGQFFRLDDHLRRFRNSMERLRMQAGRERRRHPPHLAEIVRRTGLRRSYVAMDCLRSSPPPGLPRHPRHARCYLACFAVPYVSLTTPEMDARGVHLMIPKVRRIAASSVDPQGEELPLGRLDRRPVRGRRCRRRLRDPARCRRQRHRRRRLQRLRHHRPHGGDTGPRHARRHHPDDRLRAVRGDGSRGRRNVRSRPTNSAMPTRFSSARPPAASCRYRASTAAFSATTGRGHCLWLLRELYWKKRSEGWHGTPIDYR